MRLLHKIFLLSVFIFLLNTARAQTIKSFTHDSIKFLDEMATFFDFANKKEGKDFIEKTFKPHWIGETSKMTAAQRKFVYVTCNEMMKKKFRPYPEFKNFLTALMHYYSNNLPAKTFTEWQQCTEKTLAKLNNKKISAYLEASELLFEGNVLFRSNALAWSASNGNYTIAFDSLPKVIFSNLDLTCTVKGDSATIYNTQGTFYPSEDKWVGKGGKVTWARTGLDENTVYAEIKKYDVSLRSQGYSADSSVFYNKTYFPKPIIGKVSDKAVVDATSNSLNYPKFESYSKRFQISGIIPNMVDFEGGFTMSGNKFIGSGSKEEDAYLTIKRNGKKFLVASSKSFVFKKDRIIADDAAVVMHLDADSIYHPGLQLALNIEKKELNLIRTQEGISKTPYFDTYHKVDMYVEEVFWKLDSAKMDMKTMIGSTEGAALFESSNYFRLSRFNDLQMMDELNPLTVIKDFSWKNDTLTSFKGKALASYMKRDLHEIQPLLVKLSTLGFIIYDIDDDQVTIKPRLFDYIWNRAGKKDYDVLTINSLVKGGTNNAVMNLLNYDLKISGVSQIFLSDSQNVFIYPEKREIVLKKNRNFAFAGAINAGLFEYYGKNFTFDYDKFKINLTDVDSLRLSVRTKPDAQGFSKIVKVKTVIQDIDGELLIDDMGNKSGVKYKQNSQYPVFKSNKESFVYYDKKNIQKGAYNKDKFYFKLEPYTIDSLDNFSPEGLKLDGEFVSAGIFPQFKEQLTIQPDYSLGFVRQTPPGGFPLYGTKGNFDATIRLSHKGLQGDGTLKYLTSIAKSTDILFYPDSINANAESFDLAEQKNKKPEYPPVKGDTVYIHWMPKKDVMQILSKEKPFDMYDGKASLTGRIDYTPKAMTGSGKIEFAGATLESFKMVYGNTKFDADTCNFRLKALELQQFAFSTVNMKAHIDFDKKTGDFKSNGDGSIVKFDVNQYMCYMDQFKWYMDQGNIELSSDNKVKDNEGIYLEGPEFISINPKQDSLRFYAPKARFDLKKYIIYAKEVKYINTADARVYPDSGKVEIHKKAEMQPLTNAKIIANSVTKFHTLYGCNVNIYGRKSYQASGNYDYVDELKKKQTIYFSSITVDTTGQTFADADIHDTTHFMLSPNFEYQGKVRLRATDQFLTFSGSVMIQHACPTVNGRSWFKFTSQINPESIYIPVTADPYDKDDKHLASAIMSTLDSNAIYTAFLSKPVSRNDIQVLAADGFLYYDKASREYRISNKQKLVERSLTGNYLSMSANTCVVYGEGKLNLGSDLGQVKLITVGNASHNMNNDSAYFDLMIAMDFFFESSALEKMADIINAKTDLPATNFSRPTYEKGLRELIGKEKADKLISEMNLYGKPKKFPDELEVSLFLTDIKMFWDKKSKSYISCGKIGIGNIKKYQVNRMVDGYVQLKRKRSGDELNIYLQIDETTWFYFKYSNGIMSAVSSKDEFNNIIKELKPEKRQQEVPKGEKPYQFALGSATSKTLFLKNVQKICSGGSGED
ncbi:MAG: hypothetical protein AB1458_00075 [Bacteroidota bacterium]